MLKDAVKMWLPGFLPGSIKSHPNRSLKDHLIGTYRLAEKLAGNSGVPVDKEVLKWVCWTHDLGKVHEDFQKYLETKKGKKPHAEPSSFFTLAVTGDWVAAEAVRRHHAGICNRDEVVSFWVNDDLNVEKINKEIKEILPDWPFALTSERLNNLMIMFFTTEKIFSSDTWLKFRLLYSLLVVSDRMDAVGVREIGEDIVPLWKGKKFSDENPMNRWRSEVKHFCLENADKADLPGIFSLSLPTGSGKTLIGLEIAHNWARKKGYKNIIYALPFISIVEQNSRVAMEVFGGSSVQEDHSLAYVGNGETEEFAPDEKMKSFFRYWSSPIVVTTLVQLWDSIFGVRANQSINFHKLSKSVVILDEPQAIRPGLWKGFGKVLKFLSDKLDTTFLLMTATKPHIVEGKELAGGDVIEKRPYKSRYKCKVIDSDCDVDSLPIVLENSIKKFYDGSGLVVLNTKRSALQTYFKLKEVLSKNAPVFFLSRWMAPKHRKEVLNKLIEMEKKGEKRYLVSTQVVEAGVDLDFEWVFRDLGPLDSIIQVAGRCNRHFLMEEPQEVLIAELKDEAKSLSRCVYDDILLNASREILHKNPSFDESKTAEMVDEYFSMILDNLKSDPIWEDIEKGYWGEAHNLIDKKTYGEVALYVELDDGLKVILDEISNLSKRLENVARGRNLVRKLQVYRVDVPLKYVEQWSRGLEANFILDDKEQILYELPTGQGWFLSKEGIGKVYSMECGFIPPSGEIGDEC